MKFKVGDKVRSLGGCGGFKRGDVFLIHEATDDGWIRTQKDSNGVENGWHERYFELVEADPDTLESLVDAANKGLDAINKLRIRNEEVETYNVSNQSTVDWPPHERKNELLSVFGTILSSGYSNGGFKLRVKSRPAFEHFFVSQGLYRVNVIGDKLLIGCSTFNLKAMQEVLGALLCANAPYFKVNGHDTFVATRLGIKQSNGEPIVSWEDARKIYDAIKAINTGETNV